MCLKSFKENKVLGKRRWVRQRPSEWDQRVFLVENTALLLWGRGKGAHLTGIRVTQKLLYPNMDTFLTYLIHEGLNLKETLQRVSNRSFCCDRRVLGLHCPVLASYRTMKLWNNATRLINLFFLPVMFWRNSRGIFLWQHIWMKWAPYK